MARAIVEREPVIPAPPPAITKIVLELTEEEAVAVAAALGRAAVGVGPGYCVYNTLSREGLAYVHPNYDRLSRQMFGD